MAPGPTLYRSRHSIDARDCTRWCRRHAYKAMAPTGAEVSRSHSRFPQPTRQSFSVTLSSPLANPLTHPPTHLPSLLDSRATSLSDPRASSSPPSRPVVEQSCNLRWLSNLPSSSSRPAPSPQYPFVLQSSRPRAKASGEALASSLLHPLSPRRARAVYGCVASKLSVRCQGSDRPYARYDDRLKTCRFFDDARRATYECGLRVSRLPAVRGASEVEGDVANNTRRVRIRNITAVSCRAAASRALPQMPARL